MFRQQFVRFGVCLFAAVTLFAVGGKQASAADTNGAGIRQPPRSRPEQAGYVDLVQGVLEAHSLSATGRNLGQEESAAEAAAKAEILDSDAMLEARVWLDEYFAVQIDFDEQEVTRFRQRLGQMSSTQLRLFLVRFERERARLKQDHATSERLQAEKLALNRTARERQQAAKKLAASVHHYDRKRSYFHRPGPVPRRRPQVIRPPLISSLEVARYTVYRSLFGGWW